MNIILAVWLLMILAAFAAFGLKLLARRRLAAIPVPIAESQTLN